MNVCCRELPELVFVVYWENLIELIVYLFFFYIYTSSTEQYICCAAEKIIFRMLSAFISVEQYGFVG